jgi:hypothetical protein
MRAFSIWSVVLFTLSSVVGRCPAADPPERVTITVVAVMATNTNTEIDPRLKCLAQAVQKKHPTLTGFTMGQTTGKVVPLNSKDTFPLTDDLEACIYVQRCKENPDRYCLKVKAGTLVGEITYSAACGKYFPLVTEYSPKKGGGCMILAIMVEPCSGKEKEKEKDK